MDAVNSTYYVLGGYCDGPEFGTKIRELIVKLCNDLKSDAVALVDVIAPTDFVLNSAIGRSDGEVIVFEVFLEAALQIGFIDLQKSVWCHSSNAWSL